MNNIRILQASYKDDRGEFVMRFAELNERCAWRVKTMQSKEPATFAWLQGLEPTDILYDVGANIGVYSVFAAVCRGCRVIAFEPEAQNYAALNLNLALNGLGERVKAYCLAASAEGGFFPLNLSEVGVGGSGHEVKEAVGYFLEPRPAAFKQGCLAVALEDLVDFVGYPTHVKIDVDGFEHEVVQGLGDLLNSIESLCVEVNPAIPQHLTMVQNLVKRGFEFDPEQVREATRTEGQFKGVAEHIFWRKA